MDKKQHLIWIDLEMTGLSPDTDRIIEIATIITNTDLQVVADGQVVVLWLTQRLLNRALPPLIEWLDKQRPPDTSAIHQTARIVYANALKAELAAKDQTSAVKLSWPKPE